MALIERGATWRKDGLREGAGLGGTCVNMGCVPKKLMYMAAGHYDVTKMAPGYGVELGEARVEPLPLLCHP